MSQSRNPKAGPQSSGFPQARILFLALAAATLAACSARVPAAAPDPSLAGRTRAVAVPANEREPRLRNLTKLTHGGENAEAYFSADGRQLIFQARWPGGRACDEIFTMDVDGSNLRRVSTGTGRTTCGFFFPDGERIVYSSTHAADTACPAPPDYSRGYVWPLDDYEIYSARADGSGLRRLTNSPGYDTEATISPDGRSIVFTSVRDGDLDIYVMDADGGNVRRLTHEVGYDGGAFFSADGRQIVYRAHHPASDAEIAEYRALLAQNLIRPTRLEVWVMDADGSNKRQVTRLGAASFAPFFHPDGRRIIFSSNHHEPRGRDFELYMIGVDGSGLERITHSADFDGFPMFSRDGKKLAFASNRHAASPGETNIFIADWVEREAAAQETCPAPPAGDDALAMLRYLASDSLEGRLAGSAGERCAGAYIASHFARLGLEPGGAHGTYFQGVELRSSANPHAPGGSGRNVVGILRGTDPRLRAEAVVIGAHYDHLGRGGMGSLAPGDSGVHNGADDNASGVVALLEAARALRDARPARSVVFVAFTGEEGGLLGSTRYVAEPAVAIADTRAMLNLDMVGRLATGKLIVSGVGTAAEWPALLDAANRDSLPWHGDPAGFGPSDHTSFYLRDVPVLHFFTNVHADYHRPSDDWERVDIEGVRRIGAFTARIAAAVAGRAAPLAVVPGVGRPTAPAAGGGGQSYLGTVPDFTPVDYGVRLSGVTKGSPGDVAGLRAGDVLVAIGEHDVADLQAMTNALRAHQPGDRVRVTVIRDGERVSVDAVLGRRGS